MELKERILLDISKFSASMEKMKSVNLSIEEQKVVELAKMYASDSEAWLKKGDLNTAFSSISYAHGLSDAILKLKHKIE